MNPNTPTTCADSTIEYYNNHAQRYAERTLRADMSQVYDIFMPYVPPGGNILDAGCGPGRDLKVFKDRGFNPIGIDESEVLVTMARSYSNSVVIKMRMQDLPGMPLFAAVWACASLQHLPRTDFGLVISNFGRSLVAGGVLYFSIPLSDTKGETVDAGGRRFVSYTKDEIALALWAADLTLLKMWENVDAIGRQVKWRNVIASNNPSLGRIDCSLN